jgi:hypothetical protein
VRHRKRLAALAHTAQQVGEVDQVLGSQVITSPLRPDPQPGLQRFSALRS